MHGTIYVPIHNVSTKAFEGFFPDCHSECCSRELFSQQKDFSQVLLSGKMDFNWSTSREVVSSKNN